MQSYLFTRAVAVLLALASLGGLVAAPAVAQPAEAMDLSFDTDASDSGEMKTLGMVALSGWTPLMDDVAYIGELIGRPEQAKSIEGMIALFTQGRGLQGIDKTRPWGLVVQSDGMQFVPLICLPIDDLPTVLGLVQAFGVMSQDAGGGVMELTVPNQPAPLFAKPIGEWVYISQTAEALDNAPADPTDDLNKLVKDYDIGARGFVQNIPAMYREMAIDGMRQGMQEGLEREDDESDEQFEARKEMTEAQLEQLVKMIKEMDEFTIGIGVNESIGKGIVLDFSMTAVEGTETAEQLVAMKSANTEFVGFIDEQATMTMNLSVQTSAELAKKEYEKNKAAMDVLRKQMMDAIEEDADLPTEAANEALKSVAGDLFDTYIEMAMEGEVDAVMTVDATPTSLSVIGGAKVPSTDKVESALKKLGEMLADEPGTPQLSWAAKTYDGVTFHTLAIPVPPEAAEMGDMLGDTLEMAIGIGSDKVYMAAGEDWFAKVSAAMDASKSAGPTEVKPLSMVMSIRNIAFLAAELNPDDQDRAVAQMMLDALGDADDDHVRIIFDAVDNGARYRIQVEEGILRAAGEFANGMAAQMGAGGQPPF